METRFIKCVLCHPGLQVLTRPTHFRLKVQISFVVKLAHVFGICLTFLRCMSRQEIRNAALFPHDLLMENNIVCCLNWGPIYYWVRVLKQT